MTTDKICQWVQDSDGSWNTDCGKCFVFEGSPRENGARYCLYCGGKMRQQSYRDSSHRRHAQNCSEQKP